VKKKKTQYLKMRLDLLSKNVKYRWRIKKMNLLFKFCFVKILEIKRQNKLFVFPEVPIEMRADGQLNQSIRSPSTGRKCPPDKSRRNNRSIERNVFFLFFCFFGDAKCCYLLVLTTSRLLFNTPGLQWVCMLQFHRESFWRISFQRKQCYQS
jgi:hypothetical protein